MSGTRDLVLFVCTGNTCRSPMAEHLFRHWIGATERWEAASAGIAAARGNPASEGAVAALRGRGLDLRPHRSQPLRRELVDRARLVVVMTAWHREAVLHLCPAAKGKVFLLTSFGPRKRASDIEDPIGGSRSTYERVCAEIEAIIPDLVLYLHEAGEPKGSRKKGVQ